jgi:hypothetical protein
VKKGETLGRVSVETVRGKRGQVTRYGTFRFMVALGDPRRTASRDYPLPYLGGGHGKLP